MRPSALPFLAGAILALAGCTQVHAPFYAGHDPYAPSGDGETMRRVRGQTANEAPLQPAGGNVWPRPIQDQPTLETLEQEQLNLPGQPAPPPMPAQAAARPIGPGPAAVPAIPPVPRVAGTPPFTTPHGTAVPTGGTPAYRTVQMPDGTTAIVVPNGNGTSTIIRPDGTVETVPTPK
ncbi:MAG: hypothetical protein KGI51_02045 [Rhodospirillales bacterium]|nr:hypothetical protein [Rhodospirillales bacterium]